MRGLFWEWRIGRVFVCVGGARAWWGGGVFGVLWARDRVGAPLVGVWVASRERACLGEVCGWVGDVEGVVFLEELFGF